MSVWVGCSTITIERQRDRIRSSIWIERAYCLEQFGPSLKAPKTRLVAPELTDELRERLVSGCNTLAGDRHFTELTEEMNQAIVATVKHRG